jgi:hypothetical protein
VNVLFIENVNPWPIGLNPRNSSERLLPGSPSKNEDPGTAISIKTVTSPATKQPKKTTPKRAKTGKKAVITTIEGSKHLLGRHSTRVGTVATCVRVGTISSKGPELEKAKENP